MSKRIFDLVLGTAGLMVLAPVLAIIAIVIRVTDGTPVLFRQERIGRDGAPFTMLKFRSMRPGAPRDGRALTIGRDPRITGIGHWLRRTKLDELPQLVNVLRGEMSLVGPRPEVREYVDRYSAAEREVLALKPGVTDPASIAYRDEAALLGRQPDPERYYVEVVMPEKIRINLEYARRAGAWSDLGILLRTLGVLAKRGGP